MSCSFSGIDASNPPCSRYDFQIVGTGSLCEEKSSFLFLNPVEDAPPTARQAAFFVQTARVICGLTANCMRVSRGKVLPSLEYENRTGETKSQAQSGTDGTVESLAGWEKFSRPNPL